MPKSKNRRKPKGRQGSAAPRGQQAREAQAGTGGTGAGAGTATIPGDAKEREAPARRKVGPLQFLRQVRDEGQKVTWTSRNETIVSTIMVLIMVAIMSAFFLSVDQILRWIVPMILNINA